MADPNQEIRRSWNRLAGSGHEAIVDDLLLRHAEPHRRYHTAAHVAWVLRHVDDLLHADAASKQIGGGVRQVIVAAALFHDVIYCPQSRTNEHDSALLASSRLANLGWSEDRRAHVSVLIEKTAGHEAETASEAVLLDADLAILGAPPAGYRSYVSGVRDEYAHVPDDLWRTGRAAVLSTFLERPQIFATATMRDRREARARKNLTDELGRLGRF